MNIDDVFREYYDPAAMEELKWMSAHIARAEGFSSVEEWQAHHKAEARRPINRLRRTKRRIQGRIVRTVINYFDNPDWDGSGW